jgi:hypothetical protein
MANRPEQTSWLRKDCCLCGDEIGACEPFKALTNCHGGAAVHPRCEPKAHRWRKVKGGGQRCTACGWSEAVGLDNRVKFKTAYGVWQSIENCLGKGAKS